MLVKKNMAINLAPEKLLSSQGFKASPPAPEIALQAEQAIREAAGLVEPAFVLNRKPVIEVRKNTVHLPGTRLKLGPYAFLLEQAVEIVVYVTTIGSKLEQRVNSLSRSGKFEEAYWLDCAGVLALKEVDCRARAVVEKIARAEGYGVGLSLSPGSLQGWAIEEQEKLCSLLDISAINVSINSSALLVPYKSASSIIGIGPGYTATKVDSACDYCVSTGNCWMKHVQRGA